jgi:transcriptional regulator with XRE-family HTH domain
MNDKKFIELLKNYNGGFVRGSSRKLAKALSINESSISNLIKGRQTPSEKLLKQMAKVLKVSQPELENIFNDTKDTTKLSQENSFLKQQLKLKQEEINFLKEKISFLETKK